MNTEFLKLPVICGHTKSENKLLYAKVLSILEPPPLSACAPHFVCSANGTGFIKLHLRLMLNILPCATKKENLNLEYNKVKMRYGTLRFWNSWFEHGV